MERTIQKNKIPLLVTLDLEIAPDHDLERQRLVLYQLNRDLSKLDISATIFVTAEAGLKWAKELQMLRKAGHEIGCHGLSHSVEENYRKMPFEKTKAILTRATEIITDACGAVPRCFRGPRMTTSANTHSALDDLMYHADFSVCSQRFDFRNSRGSTAGWLIAPRVPYFSSKQSPYRKGTSNILVVPLSSLGLPFLSGTLFLLGLPFMKLFANLLYYEAKYSGKPIVYLFHSYEFSPLAGMKNPGRKFLHRLYLQSREKRYEKQMNLLSHLVSLRNAISLTASEYVESRRTPDRPKAT